MFNKLNGKIKDKNKKQNHKKIMNFSIKKKHINIFVLRNFNLEV
jgi:hypothetical protein